MSNNIPNRYRDKADICLLLEGTYPYVQGGVSNWTHELITSQSHLTFHIVCIVPPSQTAPTPLYDIPSNVVSVRHVVLSEHQQKKGRPSRNVMRQLEPYLKKITTNQASQEDFAGLLETLNRDRHMLSDDYLLNSPHAWEVMERMYEEGYGNCSMVEYFWSWRSLFGSIFSTLLCPLPDASVYHSLCTGYGGLMAARAKLEKNKPVILTEHGIYTSERRVDIASANWLQQTATKQLTIDPLHNDMRDMWMDAFANYSRICYDACDHIITLYAGNQAIQKADGADHTKMSIIPNGVDVERYGAIEKISHDVPTIALIGRVVPIKDVKTFIRACAEIKETLGELKAYIMGDIKEEEAYVRECRELVSHLLLDDVVEITGTVSVEAHLPKLDLIVLTSISEAQPLVILEAGAAGIPVVTTRVGACEEMVLGREDEMPALGHGGEIVALANPHAVATSVTRLLTDAPWREECSHNIRARVHQYYTKAQQQNSYRQLYQRLLPSTSKTEE